MGMEKPAKGAKRAPAASCQGYRRVVFTGTPRKQWIFSAEVVQKTQFLNNSNLSTRVSHKGIYVNHSRPDQGSRIITLLGENKEPQRCGRPLRGQLNEHEGEIKPGKLTLCVSSWFK
jgi:hypothetical protein